jgi:lipoate-protein ligase A
MSVYHLPLTLETPAANLALDQALLDAAESGERPTPTLRTWESPEFFAVLGRSSPASVEVDWQACRRDGVSVHRRTSGGQTVVVGPGCLMYSLVLPRTAPTEQGVTEIHQEVLGQLQAALTARVPGVRRAGVSDLAIAATATEPLRKFSGNSLRLRRGWLLYHGTLLYNFPLERIAVWLGEPVRRPDYRGQRGHGEFVTNLALPRSQLLESLQSAWGVVAETSEWPRERTMRLAKEQYAPLSPPSGKPDR